MGRNLVKRRLGIHRRGRRRLLLQNVREEDESRRGIQTRKAERLRGDFLPQFRAANEVSDALRPALSVQKPSRQQGAICRQIQKYAR